MNTLFLITARGGSKGVPGKNLKQLGGIPLVGFKAISALRSKHCTRLIISTDDPEIQQTAMKYGAEAPFLRPSELATDTASSTDVIDHAMSYIESETNETYDAVMLLEPSSPFARAQDYDGAVDLMLKHDASVVVGVRETEVSSTVVGPLDSQGRITAIIDQVKALDNQRRQDLPKDFTPNGALYLFRWDFFKKHHAIYQDRDGTFGYPMDRAYSLEVDEKIDLAWAEFMVQEGHIDMSNWR